MKNYQVGFARVEITPTESVPLAGFGRTSQRMSRCVRDPLYASCFVITDENQETVVFMNLDLQRGSLEEARAVQASAMERYGIPADRVMVCGTHTHAGPDMNNEEKPSIARYRQWLAIQLPVCLDLAMADRQEAMLYMGDVETRNLNFVRHYYHVKEDGEKLFFGDNFGTQMINDTTHHATEVDPTAHILKFVRHGRKDLILVNFRAHGTLCSAMNTYHISADLMGGLREEFENRHGDCLLTYFQGASGNVNPWTRIPDEKITNDCVAYSRIFADFVEKGLMSMRPVEPEPIKSSMIVLDQPSSRPTEELLALAQKVVDAFEKTGDIKTCLEAGLPAKFRSPYHAGGMLIRYEFPETLPIELHAVTLGDLAIVTTPCEMFDTTSVFIEDNAPFAKVLNFGYCNEMQGYLPTRYAIEYGCYEADCTNFVEGTAETVGETLVQMLLDLK